jgi:hypothetical protein
MARILITSLALCFLLLSAGKSYANANLDAPASNSDHHVVNMQVCNMTLAETCEDAEGGSAGLFSHFNCHLNMSSLVTGYYSIGLTDLPSPNYNYQFSSKVHIQALSTKPPQVA